jgi:plasmid stability protein
VATFLIRLPDDELTALRVTAQHEQRSMNDLAREGIRHVTDTRNRDDRIRELTRRIMSEDAELLKRLADR